MIRASAAWAMTACRGARARNGVNTPIEFNTVGTTGADMIITSGDFSAASLTASGFFP